MATAEHPEIPFEVKLLFLRELDASYRLARNAFDDLLARPEDRSPLVELQAFFHRLGGTAANVGFGVLGNLAMILEDLLNLALEGGFDAPKPMAQMISQALAATGMVLDEHGMHEDRPLVSPPPRASIIGLTQPALAAGDRVLSKVLVVDDDVFSASLIDNCLRNAGLISTYCSKPEEALSAIQRETPDLIILDVQMPGIDGFDLCRRIRAQPALQFTPIIFVTRRGDLEQRVRGLEVGGNDYISKPFEPQELVARVRSHLERLAAMRDMAIRDGLTRCFNHKYFKMRLLDEVARALRYKTEVTLAMLDVDFFKTVNDTHGHRAGDAVLVELSSLLLASVRSTDVVARYGGEEFVVLFVEAGAAEAAIITNRIRYRISKHAFAVPSSQGEGITVPVTVSFGVAQLQATDSPESLVGRADQALYQAKREGRNRVVAVAQ